MRVSVLVDFIRFDILTVINGSSYTLDISIRSFITSEPSISDITISGIGKCGEDRLHIEWLSEPGLKARFVDII